MKKSELKSLIKEVIEESLVQESNDIPVLYEIGETPDTVDVYEANLRTAFEDLFNVKIDNMFTEGSDNKTLVITFYNIENLAVDDNKISKIKSFLESSPIIDDANMQDDYLVDITFTAPQIDLY